MALPPHRHCLPLAQASQALEDHDADIQAIPCDRPYDRVLDLKGQRDLKGILSSRRVTPGVTLF